MTAGPVVAWAYCEWCKEMTAQPHACPYVAPTCPTTDPGATGEPCGTCADCLALQAASLARFIPDALHGSPSDLDHP